MEPPKFVVGDFQIDVKSTIHGGEATIFTGSHSSHGKVAIKKWKENYCNSEKETVLKREIEILMKNPNDQHIIEVIGFFIDEESKCIGYVMPYMVIGSLEDVIHNKGKNHDGIYTDEQKTTWITKTCLGLSHLHSKNIIHRDIKPRESYDEVKLADFGIARSVANITHSLTKSIGTEVYMAPEMFKNEPYTFSADIYSLSITIWEILHKRIPYDHIIRKFDLLYQISNGVRPELKDDLSEEVTDFLTRCWDDDATERPKINELLNFYSNTEFMRSKRIKIEQKKQTILLLGGQDEQYNNSLLMLDNNGQNWRELKIKIPHTVQAHGAQFLNNNLYIFGGINASKKSINLTYKLSRSLQWEKMTDMREKRSNILNSNVILNEKIWVCGGIDDYSHHLKSVEVYNPLTNKWKYVQQMNEIRNDAAAAVVNGKIFCAGGSIGIEWGESLNSVECYDPFSDVWTLISAMPEKVYGHGAIEIDGHFAVIGGDSRVLGISWVLDTTDKNAEWIEKKPMYGCRSHFSIAKIDNKIFVCGGKKAGNCNDVEIFDEEKWRFGPELPTTRSHAPAVVSPMEFARSLK